MHSRKATNFQIALWFTLAIVFVSTSESDVQTPGSQSQEPAAGAGAQLSRGAATPNLVAPARQTPSGRASGGPADVGAGRGGGTFENPGAGGGTGAGAAAGSAAGTGSGGGAGPAATPRMASIPDFAVVDAYREGKHSLAFDGEGKQFRSPKETRAECDKDANTDACVDRRTARLNDALLTLMGISAGTYLGFKIPENTTAPPPPTTGAAGANPSASSASGNSPTANAPAGGGANPPVSGGGGTQGAVGIGAQGGKV